MAALNAAFILIVMNYNEIEFEIRDTDTKILYYMHALCGATTANTQKDAKP